MSSRYIRVLAAAALLAAGVAQAEINGPTIWYSATVDYVCDGEASSRVISEPSMALCQHYLNQELLDVNNAGCDLVDLDPCRFHFHGFSNVQDGQSLPAQLATDFVHGETQIRERYRIDEYEAEMGKLIRRLQPQR
ncbi:MAG: hypothetical protein JNN30_19955 [Rhodanobacteraceae bacterium]|nr:hypothetical protein [Rhodanobacteraceae bacterium]